MERYYCQSPIEGDQIRLTGSEAHHLLHVMRRRVGESVLLFDGRGGEFECQIEACGRSDADLRVVTRIEADRELACRVTVAAALPKGDRQRWLIEKLVELGVQRFIPLITERSVAIARPSTEVRMQKAIVAASKQCGRNRLMQFDPATRWDEFLQREVKHASKWLASPGGAPLSLASSEVQSEVSVAIGPEGGLTRHEIEEAQTAGWATVDLGPRILRIETAAVAIVAAVSLGWPRAPAS